MGWVVSVTPRPSFTPGERTPGTHWIGGWVVPRAGLDASVRRKILCPCRGLNPDRPARSQTLYWLSICNIVTIASNKYEWLIVRSWGRTQTLIAHQRSSWNSIVSMLNLSAPRTCVGEDHQADILGVWPLETRPLFVTVSWSFEKHNQEVQNFL
jgi:hypothetical protein